MLISIESYRLRNAREERAPSRVSEIHPVYASCSFYQYSYVSMKNAPKKSKELAKCSAIDKMCFDRSRGRGHEIGSFAGTAHRRHGSI